MRFCRCRCCCSFGYFWFCSPRELSRHLPLHFTYVRALRAMRSTFYVYTRALRAEGAGLRFTLAGRNSAGKEAVLILATFSRGFRDPKKIEN